MPPFGLYAGYNCLNIVSASAKDLRGIASVYVAKYSNPMEGERDSPSLQ